MLEVSELLVGDNFFLDWRILLLARQGIMSSVPEHYFIEKFRRVVYKRNLVRHNVEVLHFSQVHSRQPSYRFQGVEAEIGLLVKAHELQQGDGCSVGQLHQDLSHVGLKLIFPLGKR